MAEKVFDVVFLGGGPAGYQGAIRAAQLGCRAAVVEAGHLGGVCLNRGCIPTKAIRASVELFSRARRARNWGIKAEGVQADLPAIMERKDKVVGMLRNGIAQLFRGNGVSLFEGRGRLLSPQEIEVDSQGEKIRLKAQRVVIATGSRPAFPPPFAAGMPGIMTTDDILQIRELPASLLIVGGGVIGVEMASILAELGSSVTVAEMRPRLLPAEDGEVVDNLTRWLKRQKVKVITGTAAVEVQHGDDGKMRVLFASGQVWEGQAVLIAAGRAPNVEEIGLEEAGFKEISGPLRVNERMETEVPGIYAAGDVAGGWLLAHVAFMEGIVAAENAAGKESRMDYRVVPRCIFSFPEYGAVGLSEEEAKARFPVRTVTFPFRSLGMAQALGEWEGMVKLITHEETGEILGGHILGPHAGDLIAEVALAMRQGIPARGIMETIHIHPTLSEAVLEAAQAVYGQAIHILPSGSGG